MPLAEKWKSKAIYFEFQAVAIVVIVGVAKTKLAITVVQTIGIQVALGWKQKLYLYTEILSYVAQNTIYISLYIYICLGLLKRG